jgi:hypothetical protein
MARYRTAKDSAARKADLSNSDILSDASPIRAVSAA